MPDHDADQGYPVEVMLAGTPQSVVLADQVRSQDRRARKAASEGRVSAAELAELRAKLVGPDRIIADKTMQEYSDILA